jgi:pyruvate dehydrogenase E1 component
VAATEPQARDREAERRRMRDWLSALDDLIALEGPDAAERLLGQLQRRAAVRGVQLPFRFGSPPVNTVPRTEEPRFPGDLDMERRIERLVRWNAMAMVVRANRRSDGIGGHISTFASAATLFEVGFNHFFRGADHPEGSDLVFFQGHASPGVYARAFLEGRLTETDLENFRRELLPAGGLASYPHPWLMPRFWEVPTVSMGLAPIMAIYQARFARYLENRGQIRRGNRTWVFVGDGEMDEPEATGALGVAAREGLDNLVMVVNCNLQRLDGPVRGNGRVVDELESLFLGAGWRVVKVLWGRLWDPLLEADTDGVLQARLERVLDGELQKYVVEGGAYTRRKFWESEPRLARLVAHLDDAEIEALNRDRGGHDPQKVYSAYHLAVQPEGRPTVVLAMTIKGYGLGAAGEAHNVTHQTKKLSDEALRDFRDRFELPIPDDRVTDAPLYRPSEDSPEIRYLLKRREKLGGFLPRREVRAEPIRPPAPELFARYHKGSGDRPATTTMMLVRMMADLLRDPNVGKLVVPIIPDEARTFGVEALFPQVGIYSPVGQRYEPVDSGSLLAYREKRDGQILEEGITEAGGTCSLIAAGTAHAHLGVNAIPFFFYYSIFGFQRAGDLLWAAGDARARGFLVGCTAGRTTLNGEGLQHEDGQSHLTALAYPTMRAWDPCYGYEVAVILEDAIRRLWVEGEDHLYYLTVYNEAYHHPPMPEGCREGILRGMYRLRPATDGRQRVRLLASGVAVCWALRARERLEQDFGVTAEVWSVTSWKMLYADGLAVERHNRLHPRERPRAPYLRECLGDDPAPTVAVSDWVKALPGTLSRWMPGDFTVLGTDGYGRSDTREALRDHFEVDDRWVTLAALEALARAERFPRERLEKAIASLGLETDRPDPRTT